MRHLRLLIAAAALGLGGTLPAHASIIIQDYFEFTGPNVLCTSSSSSTGSCPTGASLNFRFDLRESIYNGGSTIAESNLSNQRALQSIYFYQPLVASGSATDSLLGLGFSESGPDTHLQEWSFFASGIGLAPGQSCSDCTLGFSVSRQSGLNAFYYLDFHSSIDGWFLATRVESFNASGPRVTDRNFSGTTGQLTRVHTETAFPEVGVPVGVPGAEFARPVRLWSCSLGLFAQARRCRLTLAP